MILLGKSAGLALLLVLLAVVAFLVPFELAWNWIRWAVLRGGRSNAR